MNITVCTFSYLVALLVIAWTLQGDCANGEFPKMYFTQLYILYIKQ